MPDNCCFAGEIGLSGEIRAVNRVEQRVTEAEKLGFDAIFVSKYNKLKDSDHQIRIIRVSKVEEIYQKLFQ